MRLERVAAAVAIILVVLAATPPPAFAAGTSSASILSPADGSTIKANATVRIHYAGYSPAAHNISGYLTLDGTPAGTFTRSVGAPPANGTTFNVTLNATGFASGAYALGAIVFTDLDGPVTAPTIAVTYDTPPTIHLLNVTYDLDARELAVTAHFADDGGAPLAARLSSGPNSTNSSVSGTQTLMLAAARGPGNYTAILSATDALEQSTSVAFPFTVLDREAFLSYTYVAYELGGSLRLRGNVSDEDGRPTLSVSTPLGGGNALVSNNSTEWWASISVNPQLGTFNGTLRSRDPWGGTTDRAFTFTIGGPNVTIFERTVTTDIGAHADETTITVPRLLGAAIVICVDACSDANSSTLAGTLYNATCEGARYHSVQCRQITGRPGLPGVTDMCAPSPVSQDLLARTLHTLVGVANNASAGRVCSSPFHVVNQTEAALGFGWLGVPPDASIVLRRHTTQVACAATSDETCLFEAPQGTTFDLSWLQGPGHTVSVRIVGVRV